MTGYEDILHLPHHVSVKHPQMTMEERAAQFAPFAALTGHKEAISEAQRLTEERRRVSEDTRQILDAYLHDICTRYSEKEMEFCYFVPDQQKKGGSYQKKTGRMKRIDSYTKEIVLDGGDRIPLEEIVDIDGIIACENKVCYD